MGDLPYATLAVLFAFYMAAMAVLILTASRRLVAFAALHRERSGLPPAEAKTAEGLRLVFSHQQDAALEALRQSALPPILAAIAVEVVGMSALVVFIYRWAVSDGSG